MSSKVKDFEITKSTIIDGVYTFKPSVNTDLRGTLYTTFYKDVFDSFLPDNLYFKHDKFSKSLNNVIRGIHGDIKSWKLVTAVFGEILQVVVDCRKDSSSYLQHEKFIINENNQLSVLLPPGIGNSFYVMSDIAIYHYKLAYPGEYLDAEDQFSLKWDDPKIGIKWPNSNPLLSDRDK